MGQQVSVVEKPSPRPGVLRFETNRSLTGMGHEHFTSVSDAVGPRPAAALARQLLSTGKVDSVYIYGNVVSVDIAKGFNAGGLGDVVRNMYQYWKPGMEMPTFDAPAEEAAGGGAAGGGSAGGGGGGGGAGRRGPGPGATARAAVTVVAVQSSRRIRSWCRSRCASAVLRRWPSGRQVS